MTRSCQPLPNPNQIFHTIASTAFLHQLHNDIINHPTLLTVLSKVVEFCGIDGSRVGEACSGDWRAVDQELKEWLELSNPNGVKFYTAEYVRKGVYYVRPTFSSRRPWGYAEEWTVKQMDNHPVGAIYLPAEYFYGSEVCYGNENGNGNGEKEDRTKFDTLLTLAYLREICRAVAVWAMAKDKKGNVAKEGWFTWGRIGNERNRIINRNAVEILQRHIFLGNQIVGLTACREHQYFPSKKEGMQSLDPQPGSTGIPSPSKHFLPKRCNPRTTELMYFAHYGPCNLPNGPLLWSGKPAEVGLHHPISMEALHAYLEETFHRVSFPGKWFQREYDGIHLPDFEWEFGKEWAELCPRWGYRVEGCYEAWVKDGRLGRYEITEGREVEGSWEPVELEVFSVY